LSVLSDAEVHLSFAGFSVGLLGLVSVFRVYCWSFGFILFVRLFRVGRFVVGRVGSSRVQYRLRGCLVLVVDRVQNCLRLYAKPGAKRNTHRGCSPKHSEKILRFEALTAKYWRSKILREGSRARHDIRSAYASRNERNVVV